METQEDMFKDFEDLNLGDIKNVSEEVKEEVEEKKEDALFDADFKIPEEFNLDDGVSVSKSDIIENKEELKLGLTAEDIKDLYAYISGKSDKPLFIDKFTSDSEGRLRDELYIMNLLQLSKLPMLVAFQTQIQDLMYRPENLSKMEVKDLTKASRDVSAEIQGIMKCAVDSIQALNTLGALNNEYRQLLNMMTMLPEEKIARIKEIMFVE